MREIKFRAWNKKSKTMGSALPLKIIVAHTLNHPGRFKQWDNLEIIQYTGLKDKNGQEIYEGDILQYGVEEEYKGQIIFEEGAYQIKYSERRKHDFLHVNLQLFKIIGNIYENPDLLK